MEQARPNRRHARRAVALEGAVHVGGDLLVGSILDLSPRGAFFRPEAGVVEGAFTQLDPRRPRLAVGDALTFDIQLRTSAVEAYAVVRWIGRSELHGTSGVGIEFETEIDHSGLWPKLD